MPATKRKLEVVEPEQDQIPEPEQVVPAYNLEPMNEDIKSRLNVLGNSLQLTVMQLQGSAPEWAKLVDDLRLTLGALIEQTS